MAFSRAEDILKATIDGTEYDTPPQSRLEKLLIDLKEVIEAGGGGGGGTTNYNLLTNKPSVNGHELTGNKTAAQLGLQGALSWDEAPTEDSSNPVKSGGIYEALNAGPAINVIPIEWNPDLNLGDSKGGNFFQCGKLYFLSYWFKATTATTGNVGVIKLPKRGLTIGNYVIAEGDDTAVWGGKTTKEGYDYVSISCPIVVDKFYRTQCILIDNT